MEMVSYIVASILLVVWLWRLHGWLRHRAIVKNRLAEISRGHDLSDPLVRYRLAIFLQKNGIHGDANIRDGKVEPPVSMDKLHPVFTRCLNAAAMIKRLPNPNSCSLYIRDSIHDRFRLLGDLDIEDIRQIAELIRAERGML